MKNIKLIAVDLDGPLLVDTFSPIMYQICSEGGMEYSRELERNTFSRNRVKVVEYLRECFRGKKGYDKYENLSTEEWIQDYFERREIYNKNNKTGIKDGAEKFINMLSNIDVRLICYGGLPEEYMRSELKALADVFECYICTDEFRPGVREIANDIYNLKSHQVLFIDDVNLVAEHAKKLSYPFIGIPSNEAWSWQKKDMQDAGVKYIFDSIECVDLALINEIDSNAKNFWLEEVCSAN